MLDADEIRQLWSVRDTLIDLRNKYLDGFWSLLPWRRKMVREIDDKIDILDQLIDTPNRLKSEQLLNDIKTYHDSQKEYLFNCILLDTVTHK